MSDKLKVQQEVSITELFEAFDKMVSKTMFMWVIGLVVTGVCFTGWQLINDNNKLNASMAVRINTDGQQWSRISKVEKGQELLRSDFTKILLGMRDMVNETKNTNGKLDTSNQKMDKLADKFDNFLDKK